MTQEFYTIVTKKGQELVAAALGGGTRVQLTRMAVGDGGGNYYDPIESQIALVSEKYRTELSKLIQDSSNPNWFIAEMLIPDEIGGFYIREVGLYDEAGNLFAIGKIPETYKPEMTSGSDKQVYIRLVFQIANAESVTLMVDPSIIMVTQQSLRENLNALDWKQTVRAATTEPIASLLNLMPIDGVALAENDRVLVKNQTNATQNGIYLARYGQWVRAPDLTGQPKTWGVMVTVAEGQQNAQTLWMMPVDGVVNAGDEPLSFYKINSNFDSLLASDNVWTGVNTHAQPVKLTAAADDLPNIINKNTQHALLYAQTDNTETATYLATGAGDSLASWVHFSPDHTKTEFADRIGFLSNARLFQNGIIERTSGIKKAKLMLFDAATGGIGAYESSYLGDGIVPEDSWLATTPVKDEHLTTKGYVDLQILLQGGSTQRGGIGTFIIHDSGTQPSNTIRLTTATQLVKYSTYPELCNVIGTKYGPKQTQSEKVLDKAGYYETYVKTPGYYPTHTCGTNNSATKTTVSYHQAVESVGVLNGQFTEHCCYFAGSGSIKASGSNIDGAVRDYTWGQLTRPLAVGNEFAIIQPNNSVYRYKITALTNYRSVTAACNLSYVQPVYGQRWVAETYKNINVDYYVIPTALVANNSVALNAGLSISIIAK